MTQTVTRNTDSEMYNGPDSGCQLATSLIGHPSSCRACPFGHWKCVYDMTPTERNKIIVWLRTTPTPD